MVDEKYFALSFLTLHACTPCADIPKRFAFLAASSVRSPLNIKWNIHTHTHSHTQSYDRHSQFPAHIIVEYNHCWLARSCAESRCAFDNCAFASMLERRLASSTLHAQHSIPTNIHAFRGTPQREQAGRDSEIDAKNVQPPPKPRALFLWHTHKVLQPAFI